MKQIDEIKFYKLCHWVFINSKSNDPIDKKREGGKHLYAINVITKKIIIYSIMKQMY